MKQFTALLGIILLSCSFVLSPNAPLKELQIGDTAPDFTLQDVKGNYFTLSAHAPYVNGFIITFTSNNCPYSQMYEDRLIDLQKKYGASYPVIAINPNDEGMDPSESLRDMAKKAGIKGFNFPYLKDTNQQIYPLYGATRTPHVFLVDNTMMIRYIGAIDDNAQDASLVRKHYLEDAIMALEKGNEPNPSYTKAIGCKIKSRTYSHYSY